MKEITGRPLPETTALTLPPMLRTLRSRTWSYAGTESWTALPLFVAPLLLYVLVRVAVPCMWGAWRVPHCLQYSWMVGFVCCP